MCPAAVYLNDIGLPPVHLDEPGADPVNPALPLGNCGPAVSPDCRASVPALREDAHTPRNRDQEDEAVKSIRIRTGSRLGLP